jgi:hypothetical protein
MVLFSKMTRQFLFVVKKFFSNRNELSHCETQQGADLHLELKLMGELTLLEAERSTKIVTEVGNTLDSSKDSLVNSLLVSSLGLGVDSLLLFTLEELFLRTLLVADGLLGEVSIVELLVNLTKDNKIMLMSPNQNPLPSWIQMYSYLSLGKVNLGGGSNDIGSVDTLHGDTIDLVGTSDQQKTGVEGLEADDTLTTETTSKEDEDSSGSDAAADGGSLGSLARLLGLGNVLGRVEAASLVSRNNTLLTTLKFDSLISGVVLSGSLSLGLGVLVETFLSIDSATAEACYTRSNEVVSRCVGHF